MYSLCASSSHGKLKIGYSVSVYEENFVVPCISPSDEGRFCKAGMFEYMLLQIK